MSKIILFILLFFIQIINVNAENIREKMVLLECEKTDFFDFNFIYPVKIIGFSEFYIGKKDKSSIYQIDLKIDPLFKFPKENTVMGFTPSRSKYQDISCYVDYKPELLSYLFEDARNDSENISLFLSEDYFKELDIIVKEQ